ASYGSLTSPHPIALGGRETFVVPGMETELVIDGREEGTFCIDEGSDSFWISVAPIATTSWRASPPKLFQQPLDHWRMFGGDNRRIRIDLASTVDVLVDESMSLSASMPARDADWYETTFDVAMPTTVHVQAVSGLGAVYTHDIDFVDHVDTLDVLAP